MNPERWNFYTRNSDRAEVRAVQFTGTNSEEIAKATGVVFEDDLFATVEPGFGGQAFMPEMMGKVREAARLRRELGLDFLIEVDGGITVETAAQSREAGADVMVAGTSVFKLSGATDRAAEIRALRG